MFWWVTVPMPTSGSHIEMALCMSLPGSRYRYCFESSATMPGLVRNDGT